MIILDCCYECFGEPLDKAPNQDQTFNLDRAWGLSADDITSRRSVKNKAYSLLSKEDIAKTFNELYETRILHREEYSDGTVIFWHGRRWSERHAIAAQRAW